MTLRLAALWGVILVALGACAETYKLRPIREDELATLGAATRPLMTHLAYAGPQARCKTPVSMNDIQARYVTIVPPVAAEHCMLVALTTGVLSLPPAELRAVFAHSLAHLQLGHQAKTGRRVSTRIGRDSSLQFRQAHIYTVEEEAEADRYAAQLLSTVAPGGSGCLALAEALDRMTAEGDRWSEWTEQHPMTPTRASAARGFCSPRR